MRRSPCTGARATPKAGHGFWTAEQWRLSLTVTSPPGCCCSSRWQTCSRTAATWCGWSRPGRLAGTRWCSTANPWPVWSTPLAHWRRPGPSATRRARHTRCGTARRRCLPWIAPTRLPTTPASRPGRDQPHQVAAVLEQVCHLLAQQYPGGDVTVKEGRHCSAVQNPCPALGVARAPVQGERRLCSVRRAPRTVQVHVQHGRHLQSLSSGLGVVPGLDDRLLSQLSGPHEVVGSRRERGQPGQQASASGAAWVPGQCLAQVAPGALQVTKAPPGLRPGVEQPGPQVDGSDQSEARLREVRGLLVREAVQCLVRRGEIRLGRLLPAADTAEVARHWQGAGDGQQAAEAYLTAAYQALGGFADQEAADLAQAGLGLVAPVDLRARLLDARAQARSRLGDLEGARGDLREALTGHPGGPGRAGLLARLATLASGSDDLVRAAELAEQAIIEARDDPQARAQALEVAAVLDMNLDRPRRAAHRAEAALALYRRSGDAQGRARILDGRAMATFLDGDITAGVLLFQQVANLFEDCGDLVRLVTPRSTRGHALVFNGQPVAGLVDATGALETARTLGHPEGQAYALWHRSEALSALDRADEASHDAREAIAIANRLGHRGWTATGGHAIGWSGRAPPVSCSPCLRSICLALRTHRPAHPRCSSGGSIRRCRCLRTPIPATPAPTCAPRWTSRSGQVSEPCCRRASPLPCRSGTPLSCIRAAVR